MKRNLQTLLLCVAILLSCLTACGISDRNSAEEKILDQSDTALPDTDGERGDLNRNELEKGRLDYEKASAAFGTEEVVMTVNGQDVTWQEYYRWLYYVLAYIENHDGAITDWNATCSLNRDYTIADYAKLYARSTVVQYRVIAQLAEEEMISLTEEEKMTIERNWDNYVEKYGSEDGLNAYLQSIYSSKELYLSGQEVSYLYDDLFRARYGNNGEYCTDEEVAEFAEENDYVRMQYLLLKTVDEDNMLLDEKTIAEKKTQISDLSDQISAAEDPAAKFEELYAQYNEDSVAKDYPNGYTRSLSSLSHPEVREVLFSLPEGEISQPIETGYGYYILYRLPLDYDGIVEYDKKDHTAYTLRYTAATQLFQETIAQKLADAEVVEDDRLKSLDLAQLFASES